jgi:putative Ca2+/H+ antiporter (TMEM165/GDT1 family)
MTPEGPWSARYAGAMNWRLFGSTFLAIFTAEMGDKTQLATLALAGHGSSRWVVFAASSLALVATSAIAVLGGAAIARAIPPLWIKRGAGALFIVLGVVYLAARPEAPTDGAPPAAEQHRPSD